MNVLYSKGKYGEDHLQVVGDGLLMSNPKRIERAIHESTCNALLLKVCTYMSMLG